MKFTTKLRDDEIQETHTLRQSVTISCSLSFFLTEHHAMKAYWGEEL